MKKVLMLIVNKMIRFLYEADELDTEFRAVTFQEGDDVIEIIAREPYILIAIDVAEPEKDHFNIFQNTSLVAQMAPLIFNSTGMAHDENVYSANYSPSPLYLTDMTALQKLLRETLLN